MPNINPIDEEAVRRHLAEQQTSTEQKDEAQVTTNAQSIQPNTIEGSVDGFVVEYNESAKGEFLVPDSQSGQMLLIEFSVSNLNAGYSPNTSNTFETLVDSFKRKQSTEPYF